MYLSGYYAGCVIDISDNYKIWAEINSFSKQTGVSETYYNDLVDIHIKLIKNKILN